MRSPLRRIAFFIRPFLDQEIRELPYPAQLRKRLEILGPTYVKLGQILSLRKDLLPDVVTDELRNLLADLQPVDFDEIRAVIELLSVTGRSSGLCDFQRLRIVSVEGLEADPGSRRPVGIRSLLQHLPGFFG